jgi:hypothetical protein
MPDISYREALRAAQNGDVDPLDATRLPGWGWPEHETGLPPPEGGEPFRGIVIGLVGGIVLWTVLLYGLAFAAGWRPLRGWWS